MAEAKRTPDCPVCGKGHTCLVQKFGRDRMTASCGRCGKQVYFTFDDAKLSDSGTL